MAATVTLYSSAFCGYCHRAKALLAQKGVDYDELSVDGQPQRRREMEQMSGRSTVPQIWIGTTHVGGCDELYALERAGRLDALLARASE
jgi:glutaredoxin 3